MITFLWGPPLSFDAMGVDCAPFFFGSMASLAMWKQLTRCPTSGGLSTKEDKNLWTSSFLQSISLWYRALAFNAEREKLNWTSLEELKPHTVLLVSPSQGNVKGHKNGTCDRGPRLELKIQRSFKRAIEGNYFSYFEIEWSVVKIVRHCVNFHPFRIISIFQ